MRGGSKVKKIMFPEPESVLPRAREGHQVGAGGYKAAVTSRNEGWKRGKKYPGFRLPLICISSHNSLLAKPTQKLTKKMEKYCFQGKVGELS
jgi:hypothetical protein